MDKKIKLKEMLGSITKSLECSICLDLLNNPVSTKCDHPFCRFCILEFLETKRSVPCPLCKAPITKRSLNDRPQLNSMVEGVRDLIKAFQEDTGAIFSPPRGPPLMNLTPCTPESLPSKAAKGTKRKIISDSPKKTKQNCRQSKRRKSLNNIDENQADAQQGNENQIELLQYLDQGSCGAGSNNSGLTEGAKLSQKSGTVEAVLKDSLNHGESCDQNCLTSCSKATNKNKTKGDELGKSERSIKGKEIQKSFCLRSPKNIKNHVESPLKEIDSPIRRNKDLYTFNDSPVTPVQVLRHQRKNSAKQAKCAVESAVSSVQTRNQNFDSEERHESKIRSSEDRNHEKQSAKCNIDSKIQKSAYQHSNTEHSKKQTINFEKPTVNSNIDNKKVKNNLENSKSGNHTRNTRQQHIEEDIDQCSPEFELKEKSLFDDSHKTYKRQKNTSSNHDNRRHRKKESDLTVYSKVHSWLKENLDDQVHGHQKESESSSGSNNGGENAFEMDICHQEVVHEDNHESLETCDSMKVSNNEKYGDKEHNDFRGINIRDKDGKRDSTGSGTDKIGEVSGASTAKEEELKPVISQKRKIFKSKPSLQTTSVSQKKGVLVIKKVSPGGNVDLPVIDKVIEKEVDPFEFKSSQRTPVVPENKRHKRIGKNLKEKLKGKLDFKTGNTEKSHKSSEQEVDGTEKRRKTLEKDVSDVNKQVDAVLNDIVDKVAAKQIEKLDALHHVDASVTNTKQISATNLSSNSKSLEKASKSSEDSQCSIIPGSHDESFVGKRSRKIDNLSKKMKKKKEEQVEKEKRMEEMIEKINSAEDFDLLTCTQEVMEKMSEIDDSNRTASETIIPDTADLSELLPTRKKSVSFASDNVEISGTPRQTRRSVPMLEDRNRGRLLPKESRPGSKLAKSEQNKKEATNKSKQTSTCSKKADKGKPFVWEEENDSDGSTSTVDLDIHPSQEEFENPNEDSNQMVLPNPSTNLESCNQNDQQSILPADENMSGLKHPRNLMEKSTLENNSSKLAENTDLRDTDSHRQSPRTSQLHESLLQGQETTDNDEKDVFVENTQENDLKHDDLENQENMDIQIIPESVDDVMLTDDNIGVDRKDSADEMTASETTGNTTKEDNLKTMEDIEKKIVQLKQRVVSDKKQTVVSVEKLVSSQKKKDLPIPIVVDDEKLDELPSSDPKSELHDKTTQEEIIEVKDKQGVTTCNFVEGDIIQKSLDDSESTISTLDGSLNSNNSVRKSRKKLRGRKMATQKCFASNKEVKSPFVIHETPISVDDREEAEKMVETVSDTCSTSQESVSILIPANHHSPKIDTSKTNAQRGDVEILKDIHNHTDNIISCDVDTCRPSETNLEIIPATDSDSTVQDEVMNASDKNENNNIERLENHDSSRMENEHKIKHKTKNSRASLSEKFHAKGDLDNRKKQTSKTQEIYCDSDVEIISQPTFEKSTDINPIILFGSDSIQDTKGIGKEDVETVQETMETDNTIVSVDRNVNCSPDDSLNVNNMISQNSIDNSLTPTLVSQKTLNLRNSAEKKRLSAERQLANIELERQNHECRNEEKSSEKEIKNCSPDIFMMDSESCGSFSLPQNQEGLVCMDVEPSESIATVCPEDNIPSNVSHSLKIDSSHISDSNIEQETQKVNGENTEAEILKTKTNNTFSHSDLDSSQDDKKGRRNSGRKTVRGLARKRRSQNCQNSTSELSIPENSVEKENLGRVVTPVKTSVISRMSDPVKSPIVTNLNSTPKKCEKDIKQKHHHGPKISPTFAYSPQKTKKPKTKNLNSCSSSHLEFTSRAKLIDSSPKNVKIVEKDDPEVTMETGNKFENLLKDDIADDEISENDQGEIIRDDLLNFSETLSSEDENFDDKNKDKKSRSENNENMSISSQRMEMDDENVELLTVCPEKYDEIVSVADSQNHDQRKLGRKEMGKESKMDDDLDVDDSGVAQIDKEDDFGVAYEASSPLPDIIGDTTRQDVLSDSEDEDGVLIKSCNNYDHNEKTIDSDHGTEPPKDVDDDDGKPIHMEMEKDVKKGDDVVGHVDVNEMDHEGEDENSDVDDGIVTMKRKRRRIIEDDSDSNDSEDSSSGRHLDNTSSSAFSSQSEPVDTQQRNKLENELERMKKEMEELQAQLAAEKASHDNSSEKQKKKEENSVPDHSTPPTYIDRKLDSPDSDVIHEYHSDQELFLSPRSPSPPPMSPQQVDLTVGEEVDFNDEFRKHDLELSPVQSSPCSQTGKVSKNAEVIPKKENIVKSEEILDSDNGSGNLKALKSNSKQNHSEKTKTRSTDGNASKLLYSPLEKGDYSPGIMKKGNVLSPLVSSNSNLNKMEKCFVSTGLIVPQMKELHKLAVLNQCRFITKFSKEVTHVIVKTDPIGCRVCDRTLKIFQGMAQKCWILDFQWVIDSRAAGHLLPESEYEIKGDTVTEEFHYGPRKARLNTSGPLFDNIQFFVMGDSLGLQRDDLKSLLMVCGGEVKTTARNLTAEKAVVVTCSDYDNDSQGGEKPPPDELHKFKDFYDQYGVLTVSREWVLDSLTVYKIQPLTEYILTPGKIRRSTIPVFGS